MQYRAIFTSTVRLLVRLSVLRPTLDSRYAYEQLVHDVTEQVRAAALRPGDRLPSVRRMSTHCGLSVTTVLHAYRVLEARRIIEARPQSGFYVLPPPEARAPLPRPSSPPPVPREVTSGDLIAGVLESASDPALVPLGASLPDPALLPTVRLSRSMSAALRRDPARATSFLHPAGCEELRLEIARREWGAGVRTAADGVVVTCGATEALSLALRATTRPGDAVAVESPTYFGVLQLIEGLGRRVLEVPTDPREGICVEGLERALATTSGVRACVVTPTVQNPLGAVMPDSAREALVALLSKHEIAIIEDDTPAELYFGDGRPRSLRHWDDRDLVVRCGSFSKSLAPGYRLGWVVPGERFGRAVFEGKQSSTLATAAPPQLAVAEYLGAGGYERHLRRLRKVLRENVERLGFEIAGRFPDGTRVSRPYGGIVLWVQLPEGSDALALYRTAHAHGISIAPGPIFSAGGGFREFVRLSAGYPWSERTDRALSVLAEHAGGCGGP